MKRTIAVELVAIVLTTLAATFVAYALTLRMPGDPALALWRAQHGEAPADPVKLEEIRAAAGFDDPLVVQYGRWLRDAVRGDMGESYVTGRPVFPQLMERLPTTLTLAFGSLALGLVAAVPVGILAVRSQWLNRAMLVLTQLGLSIPDYFLALLLVILLGLWLHLVPVAGWDSPRAAIVPVLTLAAYPWALFARLVGHGIAEHGASDWARTARAKGLRERTILLRHLLPHSLPPVFGLLGILAGSALSASLVVEVIFAIPGAGRLLFDAVAQRDVPMVQAGLLVQVAIAVTCGRLADLATWAVNPALRRSEQ